MRGPLRACSILPRCIAHGFTMSVHIKTPEEIEKMRIAGRLASEVLDYIAPYVKSRRHHG